MKRIAIICMITICCCYSNFAMAEEKEVNATESSYASVPPTFAMDSIKKMLETMTTNPSGEDDLILNMFLSTPYEKRQYVFPQLHENRAISKKVLSHPEVAVWKGKIPTDVPPELKEYASEYLVYLPPRYYLFLDPDLWISVDDDKPKPGTIELSARSTAVKIKSHKGEFYTYPDVRSLYKPSAKTVQNYKKTDLTQEDVTRLFQSIEGIDAYIKEQPDPEDIDHALISLMVRNNKIDQDLSDPFASLVARLKKVKSPSEIDQLFKKMGWKNANDFAQKADRILKAHRVNTLNPVIAVQLQKIRAYPNNPENEPLSNLKMFARMHEAPPGDVYFVAPYLTQIRKNLKPDYILLLGTPVYIE